MQLLIGCFMIAVTVVIHAVALDKLVRFLESAGSASWRARHHIYKVPLMIIIVLSVFLAHIIQIAIWGMLFYYLEPDILFDLETAMYFSASAFTTVGFGDVYLDQDWRLLSSFESVNGFILFGWSAAFIFETISRLYDGD